MIKKLSLLFLTLLLPVTYFSQQVVTAGPDTTICQNQTVTLSAVVLGSGPGNSGTVSLSDDQYSGIIPIGFTFNFFGNNYTSCVISSNGYITFNLGNANGFSSWSINGPIPGPGTPFNSIMSPWQDINPSIFTSPNGVISYKTVGTAPNRIFIVEFKDINMFSCTNVCYGGQIHLYETTNIIETHIANKQLCNTWNNGRAIHGVQNINGTIGVAVPGRNFPNQWAAVADGKRFTPQNNTYSVTNIPFSPIFIATNIPAIQWTTIGGQILGNGNTLTVTPSVTTSYIARLPYSSCGTSFFQDTVTVTVGPMPVTTSPDTSICFGDTIQLWALGTTGQNITYSWSPSLSLSSTNISNPLSFPTQTTTYTVIVTSTLCTATRNITVTVNPLPIVTTINDTSFCPEDSVLLATTGANTYQWSPQIGQNNYVSPMIQTQYIVVGVDNNSCQNTDTVIITPYQSPMVMILPQSPEICLFDTITLTVVGANTYTWIPNIISDTIEVSPYQDSLYYVVGVDTNGCIDTSSILVVVHPKPDVNFTVIPKESCTPSQVSFIDLSNGNGSSIVYWEWTIDSKGVFNEQNPNLTFIPPGVYGTNLQVWTIHGCTDSLRIDSSVIVRPLPVADFNVSPTKTDLNNPIFYFYNQSSFDVTSWSWTFYGGLNVNIENPQWVANEEGEFPVSLVVTNQYGCKDSTSGIVIVEGIFELQIPNSFTPDENGINETFKIYGEGWKFTTFYVSIFDRWGQNIYHSDNPRFEWDGKHENKLLPQGVYVYRIVFEQNNKPYFRDILGKITLLR
jgi:gliding motility-associated-like protein